MAGEMGLAVSGRVAIVGGGLAGLAAAAALAPHGFHVTILESRQRLGGRAGSFTDPATGQLIDACQHVSMGCCTNFAHFCRTVGVDRFLAPQPKLHFLTPDGRRSVFKADPWPAPWHLGRALLGAHYLSPFEKLRVAWGLLAMWRESPDTDPPLLDWLHKHGQTKRTIERFWATVLVSALNESIDRLGFKYARKVFVEGFMRTRDGFVVHVPTVPLGRFYGAELCKWMAEHGVEVRLNAGVQALEIESGTVSGLRLRDGSALTADWYIVAVPFERVLDLLPQPVAALSFFANVKNLTASPIASVHLWFDRAVTPLPHAVLIESLGQWVFNRGETSPGEHYVQVVTSAAESVSSLPRDELQRRVLAELGRFFRPVRTASILRSKVVTAHTATFSAVPGVDRWRPPQKTPIGNLLLAGDWTATGWPATMEGAVRSGNLAAEAILDQTGRPERILPAAAIRQKFLVPGTDFP
jgi:squalene-associated FAD-dependent desaturase